MRSRLKTTGDTTQVTLPTTPSWNDWATVTVPVTLLAGTNTVAATCATGDSCSVNVDDIAVQKKDSAGLDILTVYAKDPGNYAVYRTCERVTIDRLGHR